MTKKELGEQVEQLQVQLAGCLVAAQGHTKNPAKRGGLRLESCISGCIRVKNKV